MNDSKQAPTMQSHSIQSCRRRFRRMDATLSADVSLPYPCSSRPTGMETFKSMETSFEFKSKQQTTVILGHLRDIFLIFSVARIIKNKLLH